MFPKTKNLLKEDYKSALSIRGCPLNRLFDGNQLTGNIPSTLGLVQSLEVL